MHDSVMRAFVDDVSLVSIPFGANLQGASPLKVLFISDLEVRRRKRKKRRLSSSTWKDKTLQLEIPESPLFTLYPRALAEQIGTCTLPVSLPRLSTPWEQKYCHCCVLRVSTMHPIIGISINIGLIKKFYTCT